VQQPTTCSTLLPWLGCLLPPAWLPATSRVQGCCKLHQPAQASQEESSSSIDQGMPHPPYTSHLVWEQEGAKMPDKRQAWGSGSQASVS